MSEILKDEHDKVYFINGFQVSFGDRRLLCTLLGCGRLLQQDFELQCSSTDNESSCSVGSVEISQFNELAFELVGG